MTAPLRVLVPYRFEASVPYVAPMNTSATRRHWSHANRDRQDWQRLVAFALPSHLRPMHPIRRGRVTVTRITASARHPDIDNLHMASKALFDSLVSLEILADDGPNIDRVMRWIRASERGVKLTRVLIEELESPIEIDLNPTPICRLEAMSDQLPMPIALPPGPAWFTPSKYARRAARLVAAGYHPLGARLGPEGETCGTCAHFQRVCPRYSKCDLVRTGCRATDCRAKWRACEFWEAKDVSHG